MEAEKRERLEAAGFRVGTVAEFLELTDAESELIEARLALCDALRQRRVKENLSQVSLAKRLRSSQSRVAKIEAGDPSVSLDLMARAFLEAGASREELGNVIGGGAASGRVPHRTGNGRQKQISTK